MKASKLFFVNFFIDRILWDPIDGKNIGLMMPWGKLADMPLSN